MRAFVDMQAYQETVSLLMSGKHLVAMKVWATVNADGELAWQLVRPRGDSGVALRFRQ